MLDFKADFNGLMQSLKRKSGQTVSAIEREAAQAEEMEETEEMDSRAVWSLYMILCSDQSIYTGISTNVEERFLMHQAVSRGEKGRGAKYFRAKKPLKLIYTVVVGDRALASRLEYRVKRLKRSQKEQLVLGEYSIRQLITEMME